MIKTIFLGKHSGGNNNCLGIDALKYLINDDFDIVSCVTVEKDLLYDFCKNIGIDVVTDINECDDTFDDVDLVISYGFKNLIKEPLISNPKIGCINFHPAPLPEWRGMGGVFNFALYESLSEWGVTAHFVDDSFDTGDIIKVNRFDLTDKETIFSLTKKSHIELINLFYDVIDMVLTNKDNPHLIPRKKQSGGRYISKSDFNKLREINETDSVDVIDRKIKSFFHPPYAGAFVKINNKEYSLINNDILKQIKFKD
tara:strand:+ start:5648 stop:6412 length:765 start_codon:yes stop_codon:yes gene_type:complete